MPLGPQRETPKGRAASFQGLAFLPIVHIYVGTSQHLSDWKTVHIAQVGRLLPLLVPSKIF